MAAVACGAMCPPGGALAAVETLAGWDFSGIDGGSWGDSPMPPTSYNSNVAVVGLFRNWENKVLLASPAWYGWGGDNFVRPPDNTLQGALTFGNYVTLSLTAQPGYALSFADIPAYNVRHSSDGPTKGLWQYAVGGGASFVDIGSPITWGPVTDFNGNRQAPIDLSGISALQNVAAGTTVTFRCVTWGATNADGTWHLNSSTFPPTDPAIDFAINGAAIAGPSVWNRAAGGSWGTSENWNHGIVPNAPGATVELGIALDDGAAVVTDSGNVTVGAIKFTSTNGYTIHGPGSITMQVNAGNALIDIRQGASVHTLDAPLVIASDAVIAGPAAGTGTLIAGDIATLAGNTLAIDSHVALTAGTVSGNGNTTVAGSLSAASIVQDTLTIGAGGAVTIRAAPPSAAGAGATAVPEPGVCVTIASGLLSWLVLRRHNRRQRGAARAAVAPSPRNDHEGPPGP